MAAQVAELAPRRALRSRTARSRTDLEQAMLDFYHRRCNLLSAHHHRSGIDVPAQHHPHQRATAGLAQLHQLRGGWALAPSAYAYLIVPPRQAMTVDAVKRIERLSRWGLGAGFLLASTIWRFAARRVAGEAQSGQMHEVVSPLHDLWSGVGR